ncbi:MAG: 4-hydroxy-tetrahydrodipicolinate reductase [Firmicutes bacterium]|nr:4-hydroxy-tetrahydrodipicolinate reductase [Bacillota bacterium]
MTENRTIPVVVAGITGKTGSVVARAVHQAPDLTLIGGLSQKHAGTALGALWGDPALDLVLKEDLAAVDASYAVLVDFTEARSAVSRLREAIERGWDLVVGTTGFSPEERLELASKVAEKGVGAAIIANFSLGAWVAEQLAAEAARFFSAVEIVEGHHLGKHDRPSGTAKAMAERLSYALNRPLGDIPVHSMRLPGLVAHQAVVFGSLGQVLTIRHDVHDRTAYVDGVLSAIRQIARMRGRVVTNLGEILDEARRAPWEAR